MFGISFSELVLVGLVALLVLGPERLPGAARTAGLWVGRLKRSFNAIKSEVEREIGADEIRRQLHNEHMQSLEQEARKILNPQYTPPSQQPEAAPAPDVPAPVATVSMPIDTPHAAATPATPAQPAEPVAAPAHITPVTPAPSANDPVQPPRAP
ncbi:Sec-independent protein translocase protein TatB [Pseudomonas sp. HR96]|uniref:Sec-independent protein translocase protein TatB n=1 Tax=Pseudomonas sp. HR96 TaxID=1027966 RepID=UPI002A7636F9|nr:Sec-independent protein translocase protein TatB [Pseudomonas sp. HR96]WPO99627.1 Sec-independent protein translocase protein TatB [Pseudomonas sp. HR96]